MRQTQTEHTALNHRSLDTANTRHAEPRNRCSYGWLVGIERRRIKKTVIRSLCDAMCYTTHSRAAIDGLQFSE